MIEEGKDDYRKNDKPVHRNSYCAFLDVLGFSDRIKDSFANGKGDALLQEFHAILGRRIATINKDVSKSRLYAKSFTDNIILAHPQFSKDLESEFAFILWSVSEYQFEMAQHGFFIRGGLSFGPLFVDDHSVYGPALIEAHQLESRIAVNPVVTLSEDVRQLVLRHISFYENRQDSPQNRDLLVNADGSFFINYLSECFLDEGMNWQALKVHKCQIELALDACRTRPVVFEKYSWIASYHNYFCHSVSSYPGYNPALQLPTKLTTVAFKEPASVVE